MSCNNNEMMLAWVICNILFTVMILADNNSNCTYLNNQPPKAGQCNGPLDRVSAQRNTLSSTNRGCPLNQVPIPSLTDATKYTCGECVPGSHGNYAVFGSPILDFRIAIVSCTAGKNCAPISNTLMYQCPLNYYCNTQGRCDSMKNLPYYMSRCISITEPFSNTGRLSVCGDQGLLCLENRCKICEPGTSLKQERVVKQSSLTLSNRPTMIYQNVYCINGEYQPLEWGKMTDFGPHPELVLTFVLMASVSVVIILRRILVSKYLLLLRATYWKYKQNINRQNK